MVTITFLYPARTPGLSRKNNKLFMLVSRMRAGAHPARGLVF
jgi:hypothetical protein